MALTINFVKQLELRRKQVQEGGGDDGVVEEEGGGGIGTRLRALAGGNQGDKFKAGDVLMLLLVAGVGYAYMAKDDLMEEYFRREPMAEAKSKVDGIQRKIDAEVSKLSQFDGIKNEIASYQAQEAEFKSKIEMIKSVRYGRNSIVRLVDLVLQELPQEVWVNKLEVDIKEASKGVAEGNLGKIEIEGNSANFQKVSAFMHKLESLSYFKNWRLDRSETDAGAASSKNLPPDTKAFKISATVERAI